MCDMGVSAYAVFGIGIIIDKTDFPRNYEDSCDHPEREGQRFCPQCGKKVERVMIEDDLDYEILSALEKFKSPVFKMSCEHIDYEDPKYLLGYAVRLSGYGESVKVLGDLPSKEDVHVEVRKALEHAFKACEVEVESVDDFIGDQEVETYLALTYS